MSTAVQFCPVRLTQVHPEAEELLEIAVDLGGTDLAATHTLPGQYVQMKRPGDEKASFIAIASAPGAEDRFEFLLKRGAPLADRIASGAHGDVVEITGAQGRGFPAAAHVGKHLWLFAAGSGISAIRSLIGYVARRRPDYMDVTLFYGARTPRHFAYQDEVAAWEAAGVKVIQTVSRPDADQPWPGATGYVQDHLAAECCPPGEVAVFVCGMKGMNEGIAAELKKIGIAEPVLLTNF